MSGRNRHATSVSLEASFYERNQALLGEFADIHGLEPRAADSLDSLVAATQPLIKGDHTTPEIPVKVTQKQSDRLDELYQEFGMKQELVLPEGDYDFLIVLGAIHRGNHRRLEFANKILNQPNTNIDRFVMFGGARPVIPKNEAARIANDIEAIKKSPQTDPLLAKLVKGKAKVRHESDMLRLAAGIQLGNLILKSQSLRVVEFDWDGLPVTLTHTKSVRRKMGRPRHTTEACVADFLHYVNPAQGTRIGFIATNPHIERVTRSTNRIFKELGREDLELVPAGPHALGDYSHAMYRGEVARNLYEDQKDLTASLRRGGLI